MPLFGSNFAEGFATGFATETSKAINKAVDRRDEEVSKAKAFAMKRAEQLDAEATAKDARTEKAIDKMAAKFTKGGKTDWNRVYSAMMSVDGADLDSLDALFQNIQKTEASGQAFNIDDVFKYAEGDSELSKLSKDDIFQALRAEYAAPTVQSSDTGLLSKIGLGAGTTGGERATEEMQGLFPGATRTAIAGDYGTTTVDQKPLAAAIEYGMKIAEYEKNMSPSLAESFASISDKIRKLDINSSTYTEDKQSYEQQLRVIESDINRYTQATTEDSTGKGVMTANGYIKLLKDGSDNALALSGINESLGRYIDADGQQQTDGITNEKGMADAKRRVLEDYYERQVKSQMDGNGNLSVIGKNVVPQHLMMREAYERITGSETTTTTTGTGDTTTASTQTDDILTTPPTDGEAAKTKEALVRETYPTADGYLNGAMDALSSNNTAPNYNKLLENIMRIYNLDEDAASAVIQKRLDADAEKAKADKIAQANKPTFMTREEAEKEAERIRLAQESADFAGGGA